jgi:hypothetical protein
MARRRDQGAYRESSACRGAALGPSPSADACNSGGYGGGGSMWPHSRRHITSHDTACRRTHHVDGPLAILVAHIHPGARRQKRACCVDVPANQRPVQCGLSVPLRALHICARRQERCDSGGVPIPCGLHEGNPVVSVCAAVHAGSCRQERVDGCHAAAGCSPQKGRLAVHACRGVRPRAQSGRDAAHITVPRSAAKPLVQVAGHACATATARGGGGGGGGACGARVAGHGVAEGVGKHARQPGNRELRRGVWPVGTFMLLLMRGA